MSEHNMKPCPFCGRPAQLRHKKDSLRGDSYTIRCGDTKCVGRTYRFFRTETQAIKAWNMRVIETAPDVDAAIPQRGEWENGCECSVCGMAYGPRNEAQKKHYRFCPNCGARMEGGNSDENMRHGC